MNELSKYSLFILDGFKTRVTDTDLEFKAHDWVAGPLGAAFTTHCLATFSAVMLHRSTKTGISEHEGPS